MTLDIRAQGHVGTVPLLITAPLWKQPIAQKTTLNLLQKAKGDLNQGKDIPDE